MACSSCSSNNITVTINGANSCSTCNDCNASCTTCNTCSTTLSPSTCSQCSTECLDNYNTSCIVYNGADGPCATFENIENTSLNDILDTIFTAICDLQADPTDLCEALGAVSIDCLDDVDTTGAANGNFFKFVTDTWIPADIVIADISDIVLTAPADGDVLQFDSASGDWVNVPADDCTITYTLAEFNTARTNGTLTDSCNVQINDYTISDAGVNFKVLNSTFISLQGDAGYYDPDYQALVTYTAGVIAAILADTTITVSVNEMTGLHDASLVYILGDIVVWGGYHFICNNIAGDGPSTPASHTVINGNWTVITKSVSRGYILNITPIVARYLSGTLTLLERKDKNGNHVFGDTNISRFPWGNSDITNCTIDDSITLDASFINESDTIDSKVCISGLSTFEKTLVSASPVVLTTYPHVGKFILSGGTGFSAFTGAPTAHPFKIYTDGVSDLTITTSATLKLKTSTGSPVTLTAADAEWIEFSRTGAISYDQNLAKY